MAHEAILILVNGLLEGVHDVEVQKPESCQNRHK